MFLFWRMIVLAVALAAVLYGIGRSRIRRRRIATVLGAALCLLAVTVSAMFPAENLVMSFRSPEDVFSYMESGEVLDVLEGDASCAVIYADGRHMAGNLIAAKAADGYHLPGYFSARRIFHRSDREGTFDIYRMAGTEDYYLFGTVVTKSPELRIADASGSPLRCIAAEMGVGETETLYLYAFAADCAQFAWLQIGDEQIALLKAE